MSDFNISPEFKKRRKQQKAKEESRRRLMNMFIVVSVVIIIASIGAMAIAVGLNSAGRPNVVPTPTPTVIPPTSPADTYDPGFTTDTPIAPPTASTPQDTSEPPKTGGGNKRFTTIFIDAGHGATNSTGSPDNGAGAGTPFFEYSGGLLEADLNLIISKKVRDILEINGYTVIMMREGYLNDHLTVNERAYIANQSDADCFVSIHGNSADSRAYGTRVFYDTRNGSSEASKRLSDAIAEAVNKRENVSRQPAQSLSEANTPGGDGYAVTRYTTLPAVLVETCFLTNEGDSKLAVTEEWQDKMADAIASAIMDLYPLSFIYN